MRFIKHVSSLANRLAQSAAAKARRSQVITAGVVASLWAASTAHAALPGIVSPPSVTSGDYIALLQAYWKSGVAVLVLMVGSYAFVEVGGGAVAKFREWREGKAELTDLKWFFFIGVVMLVAVVYLLTTANGIL